MHRTLKRTVAAGGLAGLLLLGAPACSDEDGDGNTADEEGEELEDRAATPATRSRIRSTRAPKRARRATASAPRTDAVGAP